MHFVLILVWRLHRKQNSSSRQGSLRRAAVGGGAKSYCNPGLYQNRDHRKQYSFLITVADMKMIRFCSKQRGFLAMVTHTKLRILMTTSVKFLRKNPQPNKHLESIAAGLSCAGWPWTQRRFVSEARNPSRPNSGSPADLWAKPELLRRSLTEVPLYGKLKGCYHCKECLIEVATIRKA